MEQVLIEILHSDNGSVLIKKTQPSNSSEYFIIVADHSSLIDFVDYNETSAQEFYNQYNKYILKTLKVNRTLGIITADMPTEAHIDFIQDILEKTGAENIADLNIFIINRVLYRKIKNGLISFRLISHRTSIDNITGYISYYYNIDIEEITIPDL